MSSPKHHPTPSGQAPKPKGILKNPLDRRPSQPGPTDDEVAAANDSLAINTSGLQPTGAAAAAGPNGLSWDESNIALHDFEKESTQRMKIDEPKTPFVRGSGGFSDDEGGFDSFALDTNSQSPGPSSDASGSGNPDAELAANTSANASIGGARRPSATSGGNLAAPAVGLDAADLAHSGSTQVPAPDTSLGATAAEGAQQQQRSMTNRTQSRSPSFSLPSSGSSSRRASSRSASAAGGADDMRSGVRRENMDVDGTGQEEAVVGVDDEEDEDDETRAQREAFAKKRNAHYGNEAEALKVAKALAAKEDEEDDDGDEELPPVPGSNGPNGA